MITLLISRRVRTSKASEAWTYPSCRPLLGSEVARDYPGAYEAAMTQCSGIPRYRFVSVGGRLRLSVPQPGLPENVKHSNVVWLPEMRLWRHYSTSFTGAQ